MESMDAIRVHEFGGPESLRFEQVPAPIPGDGDVLVRVVAAGVGPWDAWVRTGRSVINQALPVTLGSDLAGVVADAGPGVDGFQIGDPVFGVTNAQFTGAYRRVPVAAVSMLAPKPDSLTFIAAASLPVVACTAWQMVFDHGRADGTKRVLVHGAAGNVGAYAVQLARRVAKEVVATAYPADLEYVRTCGAHQVIDVTASRFEDAVTNVDIVLDTVGGETLDRSFAVLAPGGVLVSSVEAPDPSKRRSTTFAACSSWCTCRRQRWQISLIWSAPVNSSPPSEPCCPSPRRDLHMRCWPARRTTAEKSS